MEWSPPLELTRRLAAIERYASDGQVFDTGELEPILVGLLKWMAQYPNFSREFEQVFLDYVDEGCHAVTETLEFCMHTLRYPRVRERLEAIRDEAPDTARGYDRRRWVERMLDAYSTQWANAVLYDYYSTE